MQSKANNPCTPGVAWLTDRGAAGGRGGGELEDGGGLLQARQVALAHHHVQVVVRAEERRRADVALLQLTDEFRSLGGPQPTNDLQWSGVQSSTERERDTHSSLVAHATLPPLSHLKHIHIHTRTKTWTCKGTFE